MERICLLPEHVLVDLVKYVDVVFKNYYCFEVIIKNILNY